MTVRIAYLDLDGTLTRDGSMFHGESGLTLAGAEAVHALHEADVHIVPASGRTVMQLREVARMLGSHDFIAELGSVVVRGDDESLTYEPTSWAGTHAPRARALLAQLAERFGVEPHEPWYSMRAHTMLLRGEPGLAPRLRAWLDKEAPDLRAIDNGAIENGRHAYHVLPASVSKPAAIVRDLQARKLTKEHAVAFGDSEGDRAMAEAVRTFYHIGGNEGGNGIVPVARPFAEGLLDAVRQALSQEDSSASSGLR